LFSVCSAVEGFDEHPVRIAAAAAHAMILLFMMNLFFKHAQI
jgi:hypothetical protein